MASKKATMNRGEQYVEVEGKNVGKIKSDSLVIIIVGVREPVRKKIRDFLGVFPKCRTPPPHPPYLGGLCPKKKLRVYFAF